MRQLILVIILLAGAPLGLNRVVLFSGIPQEPSTKDIGFPMPDPADVAVWEQKLPIAQTSAALPDRTLAIARSFLGTPYVHGTLDSPDAEQLTVNLRELDCWTFVENSVGIALAAGTSAPAFDSLQWCVQQMRYWGGAVKGYSSRIHYFSGWLLQAEKSGFLRDLTAELGGVPYKKKIAYMSSRPQKYPPLRDPDVRRQLAGAEQRISRHPWFYIPQNRVAKMEHLIHDGDILALTSAKPDLDIAHQGFAVRKNGRVYLLHASSLGKRVVVSAQPLAQYLLTQRGQSGIMVARLRD